MENYLKLVNTNQAMDISSKFSIYVRVLYALPLPHAHKIWDLLSLWSIFLKAFREPSPLPEQKSRDCLQTLVTWTQCKSVTEDCYGLNVPQN